MHAREAETIATLLQSCGLELLVESEGTFHDQLVGWVELFAKPINARGDHAGYRFRSTHPTPVLVRCGDQSECRTTCKFADAAIFGHTRRRRMSTYSIAQAKDQLSKLVDEVLEGQQVIITRYGKPVVELRPATPAGRPVTAKDIDWLRRCRETLPSFDGDTVADIRAMRDDFE
ncbi:type II toxin-antitoxin system Phd/YefM family antitoxin [Bradyrhizobium sp.]|uniref:type II toxin-antitoxin system Phd/YefM family antitoxin n=1 Tax=Bradyrhizobium sp. TaxID=376 RepID=UPI00273266E6|nr:type II toxin-antitoxin system Phd/YefM family antitoxin [Bradyrhizobium sp.]MDP3691722.1 type II toxin-antitoxin system Phd/YefM family antitoxin [Bradyrhizobium sp.]